MISDQTNGAVERWPARRRQSDEITRAGRGPEERGEGHAEPVDNRGVLRRMLDAAVHDQLRARVLRPVSRSGVPYPRVHRTVAPELGRQPAAVRLSPERLP